LRGFAARLAAFALLLVVLQFLISLAFPAPLPQEILDLDEQLESGADVIYLGDSTLFHPVGEATTGEILQEMLPDQQVGAVSHPAYNLDLYASYVQYIVRKDRQPRAIVLPIAMRSFSPEWDRRPGYQFVKEKKVLSLGPGLARVLVRPLSILSAFEPDITQDAFLDTVVYNGETPVGRVRDFEGLAEEDLAIGDGGFAYHDALPSEDDQEALQKALVYTYMYRLDEGHRKLQAMIQIARLCQENKLDVIFYISPVNYQQGDRALGSAFRDRLIENVRVVRSELDRVGTEHVTLLDLSLGLEAYAFVDMEHLQEVGKTYVAEQLVSALAQPESSVEATKTLTPAPAVTLAEAKPTATEALQATATPSLVAIEATVNVTRTQPSATPTVSETAISLSTPVGTVEPSATVTTPITTTLVPTVPFEIIEETGPKPGTVSDARFVAHFKPSGKYPVDMVRVRFRTTDEKAQLVEVQTDVYIPQVTVTSSFPVLVYAAGTTGLDEGCAPLDEPSKQRNWGNYQGHSLAYAAQGYVVVLPNWLGFDDPERTHPYFVAELQAHVLLDAARAAYDLYDGTWLEDAGVQEKGAPLLAQPSRGVFFMGYSSGGHAIFAAKDYAIRYAPDLVVKGIVGHGPTTNVETLLREDAVFSPYIVYAYRDFYGSDVIDPADVFAPQWVSTFESDVLTKCVDDIFNYYSRSARVMYSQGFRTILYGDKLAQEFPLFAAKLAENYAGVSGGAHIPVLILQGTGDTVVTPPSQKKFMAELCAMGTAVAYWEYPAVPHTEIRRASFSDTLVWMRSIAQGAAARSDCLEQAP
jgi:pimeloyl-ACP methyl ester carboxylesterase